MNAGAFKKTALVGVSLVLIAVSAAAQDTGQPSPVAASQAFKLTGFTQVLSTSQSDGLDALALRRARFSLIGDVLKNVKILVQVDLVKSPALLDAQVDWTLSKAIDVRVGQFKIPFSLESNTSYDNLDTIEHSQVVDKVAPGWDIGSNGRDIGLVLAGQASIFEYAVGAFNGAGINKADTNDHKDLTGRLLARPVDGLSIGGSYYDGLYSTAAGAPRTVRRRTGYEAAWVKGILSLKAEYIRATDAATTRAGGYVQAAVFVVPKKYQVVLKYDAYDNNLSLGGDCVDAYTAGVNWFWAERSRLQVNYRVFRSEAGLTLNRVLEVQFQIGY
ncbi:MAG: porin [Candidatus Aminicenantales bacterium]|jgi:phosphate-selective porin